MEKFSKTILIIIFSPIVVAGIGLGIIAGSIATGFGVGVSLVKAVFEE